MDYEIAIQYKGRFFRSTTHQLGSAVPPCSICDVHKVFPKGCEICRSCSTPETSDWEPHVLIFKEVT